MTFGHLVKPKRIAVDFDGVLGDLHRLVSDLMQWHTGKKFDPVSVNDWDYWDRLGYGREFTGVLDMLDTTYLRRAVAPVNPLSCPAVKWLEKRGHKVVILSSNRPISLMSMKSWLFSHGLDTPVQLLDRGSAAMKLKEPFDVYIDDSPHLAVTMGHHVGKKELFLVRQPWNTGVVGTRNIFVIERWEKVFSQFEERGL